MICCYVRRLLLGQVYSARLVIGVQCLVPACLHGQPSLHHSLQRAIENKLK